MPDNSTTRVNIWIALEVLASTWDKPPQHAHYAGVAREDLRSAMLVTPGFRQCGHGCIMA